MGGPNPLVLRRERSEPRRTVQLALRLGLTNAGAARGRPSLLAALAPQDEGRDGAAVALAGKSQ